jgi:hypothetical protein
VLAVGRTMTNYDLIAVLLILAGLMLAARWAIKHC